MFTKDLENIVGRKFRNVFIVDNRDKWVDCCSTFNSKTDIVFCLDFGLKNELEKNAVDVFFFDHIVDRDILQEANFEMHRFLENWFKDDLGNDLLVYNGLKLGDAMLLYLLTDITSFCHFFFSAISLKKLSYESLILAVDDVLVSDVFDKLNFEYINFGKVDNKVSFPKYAFPISFWVNSNLYKNTLKQKLASFLKSTIELVHCLFDLFNNSKQNLYIQSYHPTEKIISELLNNKSVVVRTTDYTLNNSILKQRRIPKNNFKKRKYEEQILLDKFYSANKQVWIYEGYNLSFFLYQIINPIVTSKIREACITADSILSYFNRNKFSLVVPVTNYWLENRLIINCAKNNKIPVFMILNGLLNMSFENDGRDSDYVNCYSKAVKEDYFNNADNVFCLGDPRMDKYYSIPPKKINRENPVIIIGAGGFNLIDLNSYLAYEFDFLFDILYVLNKLRSNGLKNKIILKVRDNGYANQYHNFVKEYFSDLNVEIVQDKPFFSVINQADLYISIYSQTLFEASSIGIPVIYYKKDTQIINRPFDNKCELVTASDVDGLEERFYQFYKNSSVFSSFMEKTVLEKYIGPLDGQNTSRNLDFIQLLIVNDTNRSLQPN